MILPLLALYALAQVDGGTPLPLPEFTPRADAFTQYAARFPSEGAPSNEFSVPRVHVGLDGDWLGAHARVLVEGAYATSSGALIGVAGDSVVVRLREAWGGYRWKFLEARLGVIPTLIIPELERGFRFRELAADGLESARLVSPADFGVSAKVDLPADYGWIGAAATNGEGFTSRELNVGKTLELGVLVRPLMSLNAKAFEVLLQAHLGSQGVTSSSSMRLGGGVQWSTEHFGVGATGFMARGLLADPSREGVLAQLFARGTLFDHLLLAARAQWFQRSLINEDAVIDTTLALGGTVSFLELFVAWQRTWTLGAARTALPGVDANELRVVLRFRWPVWHPDRLP